MSLGPHVEKFNIVSNDHGRAHMCNLSVFDQKFSFWVNLVKKNQNSLSWNFIPRLIRLYKIQWWCSLFLFLTGIASFGQTWTKNQIFRFKLKFGNMQNSMVVFTFSVLDQKLTFRANLVQKIKIISLSWNLVPRLISICWIQWWCSLFLF